MAQSHLQKSHQTPTNRRSTYKHRFSSEPANSLINSISQVLLHFHVEHLNYALFPENRADFADSPASRRDQHGRLDVPRRDHARQIKEQWSVARKRPRNGDELPTSRTRSPILRPLFPARTRPARSRGDAFPTSSRTARIGCVTGGVSLVISRASGVAAADAHPCTCNRRRVPFTRRDRGFSLNFPSADQLAQQPVPAERGLNVADRRSARDTHPNATLNHRFSTVLAILFLISSRAAVRRF